MDELELYGEVVDGEIVDETCERCGVEGKSVVDPYVRELEGVDEYVALCDDCYQQRVWAI